MGDYYNNESGEIITFDGPEYTADGKNIVLAKTYKKGNEVLPKYKTIVKVVHPEKGEKEITDDLLDAAIEKGYQTKQLSDAKGKGYEDAEVDKYGEVTGNEASLRGIVQAFPLADETVGAVEGSAKGALKQAGNYLGLTSFDESDPDIKAYKKPRDLDRARNERSAEEYPVNYYTSQIGAGMGIGSPTSAASSLVGKGALGATEGVGYAIAGGESDKIEDDGTAIKTGAALNATVPVLGRSVEKLAEGITEGLSKKGGGAGAKYVGNQEALADALKAPQSRKEIADKVRQRNLKTETQTAPLDRQVQNFEEMGDVVKVDRAKQMSRLDENIGRSLEATDQAKQKAKQAVAEFKTTKTEEARAKLNKTMAKYQGELENLGKQRDARFEELEAFTATDQAKQSYLNVKKELQDLIGEMPEDEAVRGLKELNKFLPEEGLDVITQGQILKKLKRVSTNLYQKVQSGQGYGQGNFNRGIVAAKVNDAFKNAGDEPLKQLTEAMFEPLNNQKILRRGASKRVPGMTIGGKETNIYSPDPMKAERAAPETKEALTKAGYTPNLTPEMKKHSEALDKEIAKLEFRTKLLKSGKQALQTQPDPMAPQIEKLKQQKLRIQNEANDKNLVDRLVAEKEVGKIRDLEAIRGRDTSVLESGADVLADVLPGPVGRAARHGIGKAFDPVVQIGIYNNLKNRFQKPGLTAAVRALTLGGRSLTRKEVMSLAKQYSVEPEELQSTLEGQ